MDINSLLSPQETPSRSSNPPPSQINPAQSNPPASPLRRARPGSGKRTGSGLSNEITVHSPPHEAPRSIPSLGYEGIAQAQQMAWNPGYSANVHEVRTPQGAFVPTPNSEGRSPFGTPQHHRPSLQYAGGRATSSAGIETLSGESYRVTCDQSKAIAKTSQTTLLCSNLQCHGTAHMLGPRQCHQSPDVWAFTGPSLMCLHLI